MKSIYLILMAAAAGAQTTRYPGALDSDSSLFVVSDNVQTTLSASMSAGDTTATVASGAGFAVNMIATICDTTTNTGKCTAWEHMLVTAVSGNTLTLTRGFAGTTPRTHSSGRLVSVLIDSAHQKVLKDAVIAMQTALGPNLINVSSTIEASKFDFPPQSPGGTLSPGNNAITMSPVPMGVNGTDQNHYLYVSGGTGAAEPCLITGGTGTSGQASGQIIVNCANSHSGAWTVRSASSGIDEAIRSLDATSGGVVQLEAGVFNLYAPIKVTKVDNATVQGLGGWSPSALCHPETGGPNCLSASTIQAAGTFWAANPGSYMFTWDGSGNARKWINNGGLREVDLDAKGLASGHIHLKQVNGTDFFRGHWHDHTTASGAITPSFYFESTNVSTSGAGTTCGNTGGFVHVFDVEITSYRTGSGGVQLGTPGTVYDVCSNKFVNLTINIHMVPAAIALWLANTDSNEFTNIYIGGDNTGITPTSILSTGTTTATVTAPNHGLPTTAAGFPVQLFNACTVLLSGSTCSGAQVKDLMGPFAATYVNANTFTITGAYGLTNATTYYAEKVLPVDVSFGGCGNCGGNKFVTLTGSVFVEPTGGSGYGNYISNWNWVNDGNGAEPAYQRIGGNWTGHINAHGLGNFQSTASFHGWLTQTYDGQVKYGFRDRTGVNYGTNQQMFGVIYDGGGAEPGGALVMQSLTDQDGFATNLFAFRKDGLLTFRKDNTFANLPGCNSTYEGSVARINNSNTATWGATAAGGGANKVLVYCNGSAWTVFAK